ncbi:MAG: preprotein translocase subunit YajC [Pyrinomonadaceae bacterium]
MDFLLLYFQTDSGSGLIGYLPILLIPVIFYFILIRPQRKQQQEVQNMVSELKMNDEIVTNGGIIGKIKELRETSFIIQSADKSFIEIARTAVVGKREVK